jgi:NADP-dependent 3-hydroxy acid dehydrogenase YdfG
MSKYVLKDKVVAITGGSMGIGRALALEFASCGAKISLAARTKDKLEQVAEEVRKSGAQATCLPADVTKLDDMERFVEHTVKTFGRIDVVVCNAGLGVMGSIFNLKPADWKKAMDVNFMGTVNFIHSALKHLVAQGEGQVVIINSLSGKISMPLSAPYCSAKFAVTALADSIRAELKQKNIDVIAIYPSFVQTTFQANIETPDLSPDPEISKKMFGTKPGKLARILRKACECRKGEINMTFYGKTGVRIAPLSYHATEAIRAASIPLISKLFNKG